MSERRPNSKIAPYITRPGESLERIGSNRVTELLPDILQTTVNKQFFDSTLEQLMSSGSLEAINHYIGKSFGRQFHADATDNYLYDNRSNDAYQFETAMVNKNEDNSIDQVLAYDDLIKSLKYNEVNTNNHNKVLNETGYTLDLPINYDMFLNYHRYFWVMDVVPVCELKYTSHFDIDTLPGKITYTTPVQKNGRTLTLENGMRIMFAPHTVDRFTQTVPGTTVFTATVTGGHSIDVYLNNVKQIKNTDYTIDKANGIVTFTSAPLLTQEIEIHTHYSHSSGDEHDNQAIYIVDGVGEPQGIKLTKQFEAGQYEGKQGKRTWLNVTVYNNQEPSGFDADTISFDFRPFDLREHRMTTRDYTCEQRYSPDQSAWARSNLWVHEDTISAMLTYQGVTDNIYAIERYRAVRPIIEYKAGIEKYNFGKRHVLNVDHYLESADDPDTTIVGQTSYSVTISGINTEWSGVVGYDRGDKVKVTSGSAPNFVVTYWECVQAHGEIRKPTHGEHREFWEQITPVEVENGDLIIFFGSSNTVYNSKIWRVSGVGTSIALSRAYDFDGSLPGVTKLLTNDKILLLNGFNTFDFGTLGGHGQGNAEAPKSGAELYVDPTTTTGWAYSKQKEHRSQGMCVQLYDTDLTKLDDETKYPTSDFFGATIFDFQHNENNSYDDALGFRPEYVDYGNNPGLNFCVDLLNYRYTYVSQSANFEKSNQIEIAGYYYYKYFVENRYHNGWSIMRDNQPVEKVIKKVVTDQTVPLVVDLGHEKYISDRHYTFFKEHGKLCVYSQKDTTVNQGQVKRLGGKLPTLFFYNDNAYTITTQFPQAEIEFVNIDGTPVGAGITRSAGTGNQFTLTLTTPTVEAIKYRLVADPAQFGVIFFDVKTNETNVRVKKNGTTFRNYTHVGNIATISSGLVLDDVYEFSFCTDAEYSATGEGNHKLASTQIFNPQNQDFGKISFGDLIDHMRSQMRNHPLFEGDWYGTNNYRNIVRVHDHIGTIRQQPYSTELLNQLLVDTNTNPYSALQFNSSQYSDFKERFKQKIVQLHNSLDITLPTYVLVDRTLEALNIGKSSTQAFANSQMAMYRDYKSVDVSWVLNQTPVFDLPEEVNDYDDTFNHIQVWIQIPDSNGDHTWKSLVKDIGYTLTANKVTIIDSDANNMPGSGKNNAHIRWYKRGSVSFVPTSDVKLGLNKPFTPELRSDYSKDSTGTATDSVIIGHDGSIHVRNGTELYQRQTVGYDPIDAGLWDLELRIYNNLGSELDSTINSNAYTPNAHRPAVYTWNEVNNTIRSEFNKYKARNNITELNSDTYYDGADKFTWNYSSVGPGIGGYRGLYHYFFNTDRPHTHPWEMLGFNKKPTWWDTYYSWTDAVKRASLLIALEFGKVSDPSTTDVFDINYALKNYDWQNDTLVTLLGTLNDPVTANVVTSPVDPAKDFVFGDWGPVEALWRRTSEGKIASALSFLRTRPLIALNKYFRTLRRQIKNVNGYNNPQEIDAIALKLTSWKNTKLTGTSITGKIIESVRILESGSGYTSTPTVKVTDNFGVDGAVEVIVDSGAVVGARVTNQGSDYYNRPDLEISGGAVLDPVLVENASHYFNGLSNNIVEFSNMYGTGADTLRTRLQNLTYQPVIKAGGYVNRNNQFILESSQDKGRVFVPEENVTTLLYTNKPATEFFYGGIRIAKTVNGYTLNGYDNSLAYFIYNKPNTATDPITVNIDGAESVRVVRYRVYEENTSILDYNTELKTIQDVYDFILGYGHYLNSLGFTQQWRSASASFVNWAISDSTSELNLIPDPNKVIVQDGEDGYFDNIDKRYDGVYNLHGADGNQLQSNQLIIDRKSMEPDAETIFQVKDTDTLLYGIRLYKVQLEHIFVFENITNFDDTISNLAIGQSHDRIIWRGSRTKNWNGKLYSPGYIVDDNTILPNFDTTVKEVDQYLGRTNTLANSQLSDVARFNTGYNKPNWSDNLDLDDDSVFEFVKGSYKYKSTAHALKAFMRNKGLYDGIASAELLEKWAVRMADFGDTRPRETFEFQITPDLLETSPQPVRFNDTVTYDVLSDIVIDINAKSPLVVYDGAGNNFSTRDENTYKNTSDPLFANDLITSGLPLLQETDYRVINKEDFTQFPTEVKDAYNHDGDWQDIENFDTRRSYKFNEKVLHKGRTWTMLDEDGSSGLTTAENPIEIHGNIQLPTIPSGGQTLIVDGNTITLSKTATSTSTNTITVTGTQNIGSTNAVPHGSTVILGQTSALNNTVTFSNPVTNVTFNDIEKIGTTSNPSINGSATATLIIDGTTITFNDLVPSTSNITAQLAFENAFNASWVQNQGTIAQTATDRIARIEGLRASYVAANSAAAWTTWITTYFNNAAGINISHLITLIQAGGTTQQAAEFMLDQDLILINNIRQTNYIGTLVVAGSQTVTAVDISATQNALNNGAFIDDVATYLINSANANTTFTTTTNVATTTTNVLQTYTLTDIIQKINNAGISNVTASSDNNRLKITKTTNTPQTQFSLTISVGTQNATVGFSTAQETIQSQGSTTTTTPNLSIQQVVDQINLAGISGITAQRGANNNNLLQINCTLNQLFIGAGTANGDIGLPSGVVPASQVTTTSNIGLNISDIVEQFNAASITGVTASISNNEFKLTSTNSILTIGSGTANSSLGLTAQTFNATKGATANIFSALVDNNGNPVFLEDANDPNIFSIWVADNSEFGNYNLGYQVYQSMNFGMYTNNICVGNQSADEAQIDVVRQTGDVQAHNLQVGDYVLIRGSNSVPSLDGIHQVTRVDSNNTSRFYIDEYIDQEGNAGNIYPLRKVRFGTLTELESSRQMKINNVYKYNFAGVRQTQSNAPIYAFVDDDGTEKSAVYKWEGTWSDANGHVGNWVKVRNHIRQARNDLLDNITLYDAEKQQTLKHLEIYDPAKGIIFGFIDKEIDYKITNDVANYNYNTLDGEVHNINAWGRNYLGKIWWDISTAVYLDYEQSTIDYQQNNWGRLFDGASIDIYEWTASPVLPEAWETEVTRKTVIDGREASGEAYSVTINGETVYNWTEETYYNDKLKKTETVYYFWVKNRTNASPLKTYNSLQMSLILANPGAFNLSWAAQAGNNTLMLANIEPFVKESTVCQLNNSFNNNADAQQDWYMLSENDPNCTIPEYLHIKVRDSLAGFNRFTFDTTFTTWSNATVYAKDAVVKEGANYYISLIANNSNEQPSTDTDMSHWSRIYDYNFIEGTQADDISIWRGQPVPDLKLHKYNRYGHQVRPRQSLYRDLKEARQNFVYSVNSLLSEVNVIDEINNWENAFTSTFVEGTVTYRIKDYVNLVDWNLIERDSNGNITFQFNPNTVADLVYNTKQDYIDAGQPSSDGSYVLIKSTSPGSDIDRAEMYHFVDGTDKLVFKEKATIQLSEEMWNQDKFGHGFDAIGFDVTPFDHCSDNVIGKLMDLLRTEIFIGRHHVKYNQMWFKLLFTSILQNAADDFAFKTTYASLGVKRPLLTNKKQYQEYSIENIEEFVNSTKPFHTKLLSSLESVTFGESTNIEIDEQDRQAVITMKYEDHSTREWACDLVLSGGEFSTVFGASVDFSLFTHTQSDLAFDYNGNVFVQPACEGWGEELVPTDFTENVSIAVQTMLTPTLDSGHTRSFRMMQYQPLDLHSSNVIVDANNTTLFADINATDTTITVGNATTLDDPGNDGAGHVPGVIYIGNERITYEAIDGNNLLFCTRGTLGTSAIAHTNGDTVVNSGASTRIPTVAKFSHYGNGLRLAYNDSGMSLTEHVAVPQTPEHRFIRNAGKGTI